MPYLASDTAPAILLAEVSVQFDLCGREVSACGPKPILFTSNVEQARQRLADSTDSLVPGIKSVAWLFLGHEMVDLRSASAFVKRAREGRISRPFITEAQAGVSSQGQKRPFLHTSRHHDPATGRVQGLKSKQSARIKFKFPRFLPKSLPTRLYPGYSSNFQFLRQIQFY